jgi:hypothetical protein
MTGGGDARETWRAANSARLAQQGEKEKEARAQLKEKAAQVLKERAQVGGGWVGGGGGGEASLALLAFQNYIYISSTQGQGSA